MQSSPAQNPFMAPQCPRADARSPEAGLRDPLPPGSRPALQRHLLPRHPVLNLQPHAPTRCSEHAMFSPAPMSLWVLFPKHLPPPSITTSATFLMLRSMACSARFQLLFFLKHHFLQEVSLGLPFLGLSSLCFHESCGRAPQSFVSWSPH